MLITKIIRIIFFSSILYSFVLNQDKLPNTFLKDLDNKKIDIYSFLENGPMLVNFWFLACEPCKKEMKYLDLYNQILH